MGFRIIPSFSRTSTIAKGRTTGGMDQKFYHEYWDPEVLALYYPLKFDTSFNAGQITIINDYQEDIENYLFEYGEEYDPDEFLSFLQELMGDAKYNALSETWEQLAKELLDVWDHSSSREGFGKKKFFGVIYN